MNNLPRYSIAILVTASIILPRILPAEVKQLLSTEQWYTLVHIAVSIAALLYLWKSLSIESVQQKRVSIVMAVLLLLVAVAAALGWLGSLSFPAIAIIYAGWFVLRQIVDSWIASE